MELLNCNKSKNLVRIMRIVMLLTFAYRSFITADGIYNGNMAIGVTGATAVYATILIGAMIGSGLLAWLVTSLTFTMFSRSAYSPTNNEGVAAVSYCSYHFNSYLSLIISNLIIGSLSFIAFYNNLLSSLVLLLLSKIVTIISIIIFDVLIGHKFKGKSAKQFITAIIFPNIVFLVLF